MKELKTTIGLEIHVQLKTKSKMFCSCNNEAFGAKPNTTICPVCLGMPGTLPVANEQAILWTIKTGIALNCEIPRIAKFDRKHYFYPDLPKGYQISQYDEPFCVGGYVEVDGRKFKLTRIHLEEDAGKLIHSTGKSLVDLNRAGTPLMEIVTEPDITSPKEAGDFLRKLQKIVRDVVEVSEASMEKGHMRCDANISVTDGERMSEIVELKNLNSFRFVEKALVIEEERLKEKYSEWPSKLSKVTRGYDSKKNVTFPQRTKEEAADYRYFPEPDLPPFDTTLFDLESLQSNIGENEEEKLLSLVNEGVNSNDAKTLLSNPKKFEFYKNLSLKTTHKEIVAKALVHNYFGFEVSVSNDVSVSQYAKAIDALYEKKISKQAFTQIVGMIHKGSDFQQAIDVFGEQSTQINIEEIVRGILSKNRAELDAYKAGKQQLFGFFMGQVIKETGGKLDPSVIREVLQEELNK